MAIKFRVDDAELELIRGVAREFNLSVADFARKAVTACADRVDFYPAKSTEVTFRDLLGEIQVIGALCRDRLEPGQAERLLFDLRRLQRSVIRLRFPEESP
jgi:hypothetical protein